MHGYQIDRSDSVVFTYWYNHCCPAGPAASLHSFAKSCLCSRRAFPYSSRTPKMQYTNSHIPSLIVQAAHALCTPRYATAASVSLFTSHMTARAHVPIRLTITLSSVLIHQIHHTTQLRHNFARAKASLKGCRKQYSTAPTRDMIALRGDLKQFTHSVTTRNTHQTGNNK